MGFVSFIHMVNCAIRCILSVGDLTGMAFCQPSIETAHCVTLGEPVSRADK